ncbi:hypothetical protein BH09MYX1_BH09MYX1_48560 [soil metagenome]
MGGWALAAAAASALSFLELLSLPGRSSDAHYASVESTARAPEVDGFDVGDVHWDVRGFAAAPSLQPLRDFFDSHCRGLLATTAAWCVADAFAAAFPHGDPSSELVDASYDPAKDLARHLAGEPGHCVTRGGLIAATLLAEGIPARVVQIVPSGSIPGHTFAEVWNPPTGWAMVDASLDLSFENDRGPASAADAVYPSPSHPSHMLPRAHMVATAPTSYAEWQARSDSTQLLYPEPWLYTRTGKQFASFPLRGAFVHVGPGVLSRGPAQTWLRRASVFFGVLAIVLGFAAGRRRRRLRRLRRQDHARETTREALASPAE